MGIDRGFVWTRGWHKEHKRHGSMVWECSWAVRWARGKDCRWEWCGLVNCCCYLHQQRLCCYYYEDVVVGVVVVGQSIVERGQQGSYVASLVQMAWRGHVVVGAGAIRIVVVDVVVVELLQGLSQVGYNRVLDESFLGKTLWWGRQSDCGGFVVVECFVADDVSIWDDL